MFQHRTLQLFSRLVDQVYTKEEEEKRIAKEQAAKIDPEDSICYDDTKTIPLQSHPLSIEEPDNISKIVDPNVGRIDDDIPFNNQRRYPSFVGKIVECNPHIATIDIIQEIIHSIFRIVDQSTSTVSNLFLEETNTFDHF
ncbi:hypothetical protein Tco_0260288 [Tanacetum coccineum]|uniref:Uncharacterized protein n=1 Tax=Tanacetum coccineum TaxID=301880 RepID=A0ABQ5ARN8_9ASTR